MPVSCGTAGNRPPPRDAPPQFTPSAQAELTAYRAKGNQDTDAANCLPPGMPGVMTQPYPIQILVTPGEVTIIQEAYMQVRHVHMDGRDHPADPDLTFNGDSIGHWEGKDLVIDTIGLEPHTEIAQGVGHSDQIHIVERVHQVSPDRLDIATTITDPKILTKPWTVNRPYLRHRDWQIQEYVCEQNNHDSADQEGRAGFKLDSDAAPAAPAAH